jgi:polygalacturonase
LTGSAAIGAGTLFGAGRVGAAQSSSSARPFDVRAAGATGQRADNATHAFQSAIDACTAAGGGIVRVPPGAYTVVSDFAIDGFAGRQGLLWRQTVKVS